MFQYGHGKCLQSKTLSLENFLKSFMIFEPHNNMQVAKKYLFSQLWSTSETDELSLSGNPVWFYWGTASCQQKQYHAAYGP